MANEEQLKKLAQIFNIDRIISKDELAGVLEAVVGILANNKKSIDVLTEESRNTLAQTLQNIADEHNSIVSQVDKVTRETKSSVEAEVRSQLEAVQRRVEDLIAECKDIMPEDGKDADEELIVAEVLKQIKLPEYKEVMLDSGEDIVQKINLLPENGEFKIDAVHIKNLPQAAQRVYGGTRMLSKLVDVHITDIQDNDAIVWDAATGRFINEAQTGGGGGGNIGSINADTTAAQLLTVGTSGTDFAIADNGTGTHTFNLPTASSTNRGALSSTDWTTFNNKQNAITPAALTKTDDTNVTLTLGGSPTTALLAATSLTLGWTGTLGVTRGGTGTGTTFTQGSVVFAGASGVYSQNNTAFNWNDTNATLALTGNANNTTLNITNTSVTSQAVFSVTGPASTDVNTGKGFTIFTTGEAFARSMFYTDGKFGIGPGSGARDVYLSRSGTSVFRVSSDASTGAADIEITRNVLPVTSGTGALGSTTKQWANEFLASGAAINFNNGNFTLTHAANKLTAAGGNITTAAGTTSYAPLTFTSGTNKTSVAAGDMEFDGTNFYLSPSTTRKRIPLTNNATPTNGQIPIGNGTDYTVAAITAGSGISVTNGAGSITIAASAASPVVSYDYVIQRSGANTVAIKMSDQSTLSTNADAAVVFQAAVDAIDASTATGGSIFVKAGTYSFASVVTIAGDNTIDSKAVAIHGDGVQTTIISPASGTNGLSITNQAKVSLKDFAIYVKGTSNGIVSSNSSNGLRAFWQSEFRNIYIYGDDGTHTGWGMDLGNPFRSVFENIEINQVKNGIRMTATDTTTGYNPGDLTFNRSFIELRNVAGGVGLEIASPNTGSMNQMIFNMVEFYAGGTGQTAILLSGSAGNNHNNFNGINAEQFDTILDIEYGRNNYLDFNYIVTRDAVSTTYFKTTVDSYNNRVSCKYLDTPTRAVTIVNDANTSTLQPNVFTDIILQGTATTTTFTTTAATIVTGVRDNVLGTSRYIDPTALKAVDPGADRIPFWDDSTDMMGLLTASTGLTISGTSMTTDVSLANTATLTNKRITKRVGTTTSSATPTINTDNVDMYTLTAQTVDITSFTTNLSGTPTDGQTLWIAITGTGARAITWGASFEASTVALPTTTVTTNRLDVGFVWNAATSKWRCIASA